MVRFRVTTMNRIQESIAICEVAVEFLLEGKRERADD
jgi:hypothetical protein